jgi:Cu(I)/Ag(I) efflux system membrane fusion protein
MRRKTTIAALIVAAFLAGYGYGRWYANDPVQVSAKTTPPVLYYHCPMHPSIRSDRPGKAPCCNMAMTPVYGTDGSAIRVDSPPPGAMRISPEQEQLLGLKFAIASQGAIRETIRAVARVGLDETRIAHVQTKLDGYVDQILVKTVGTEVRKGQVLLTVYHPKSLAAQEEYLKAVKAVMGLNEESGGSTGGPRPANSEGLMAAGRLRLELMGFSEPQIETISKAMQPMWRLPVVAPIAGVVTEINALPRQKIVPETLYTIADLSTVWAAADLFAYENGPVAVGQSAILRVPSLPGKEFYGTVDSILPQLDAFTHTRKIRVRIDNPGRLLLPEMYGDLEIRSAAGRRGILIPREAVLDRGLQKIVFVDCGQGCVEPREVNTGRSSGVETEILRGLKPGERVVTSGHFLIDSESRMSAAAKASHDRTDH